MLSQVINVDTAPFTYTQSFS